MAKDQSNSRNFIYLTITNKTTFFKKLLMESITYPRRLELSLFVLTYLWFEKKNYKIEIGIIENSLDFKALVNSFK